MDPGGGGEKGVDGETKKKEKTEVAMGEISSKRGKPWDKLWKFPSRLREKKEIRERTKMDL